MTIFRHVFLTISILFLSQSVFAESDHVNDDILSLSLEQLLKIKVISASRKEESQHLAPGVITVISSQEIEQYGARHLRDVIDRLVGTQVLGSHQDFHSKTSMRAINSSHHEDTVLIMLNGRPVRQATDGGLNSDLYIGFPLDSIQHIEVIRGPGSVIYGTNAMAGVINIITKEGKSSAAQTKVSVGIGSFGNTQAKLNYLNGNDDYSLNIAFNHNSANGDSVNDITDSDGVIGKYKTGVGSNNLFVNGRYKNFTANIMLMENHQDSASSSFQLPSNPIDLTRYYVDLGYLHQFSSEWDLSFNYTYSKDTA